MSKRKLFDVTVHTSEGPTFAHVNEAGTVWLFDDVADHFTVCHRLTEEQETKIRTLAAGSAAMAATGLHVSEPFG